MLKNFFLELKKNDKSYECPGVRVMHVSTPDEHGFRAGARRLDAGIDARVVGMGRTQSTHAFGQARGTAGGDVDDRRRRAGVSGGNSF